MGRILPAKGKNIDIILMLDKRLWSYQKKTAALAAVFSNER
jgi:hypothetical protein